MEVRSPAFAALEWKSIQRLRRGTAGKNDACGSPAARRTHGRLWRAPKAPPGGGRCEPQASSGRRPSGRPAGGRPSPEPGSPGRGGTPADLRRHTPHESAGGPVRRANRTERDDFTALGTVKIMRIRHDAGTQNGHHEPLSRHTRSFKNLNILYSNIGFF